MIVTEELKRHMDALTRQADKLEPGARRNKAEDLVAVLNMALKEIREGHRNLKESMELTAASELDGLEMLRYIRDLKDERDRLKKENQELKKHINP